LYIGKSEKELIETLQEALRKNPHVKLSILTDALRGTREAPNPSSASLLAPLVEEFGADRVEIRMYHTPNLTGLRKQYIPKRINEGWGLQHMKLYGVDDEIIMSGYVKKTGYGRSTDFSGQTCRLTTLPTVKIDIIFLPQRR
jgi:CDP-diacylglycerol---glycerol-3-phosphate 3-phosphatidyltransferase